MKREYDNTPDFRNIRSSRYEFGDKRFANEATRTRSPDSRKSNDYRSKDDRDRRSGSIRPERNTFVGGRRGSSEYRSDRPMMDRGRQGSYSRGGHESDRRRSSFSNRGNHVVKTEEGYHPSFSSQNLMPPPMTPFDMSVQERMEKAHQAQQVRGSHSRYILQGGGFFFTYLTITDILFCNNSLSITCLRMRENRARCLHLLHHLLYTVLCRLQRTTWVLTISHLHHQPTHA